MLSVLVLLHTTALGLASSAGALARALLASGRSERGQATAEYAIVVVGAAVVGFLLITWATQGGGASKIGRLLDKVVDKVSDTVA